jgi:hypothetical protein
LRRALLVGLAVVSLACQRKGEGTAAGALPTASASASASANPAAPEEAPPPAALPAWVPTRAGEFVIDAHADSQRFGGAGETPITAVCEFLASDCATLDALRLGRALRVSYGQGGGRSARVDVTVLSFGNAENAYAYFTGEIAAAEELGRPRFTPLAAGAAAVIGETSALVVRAEHVAELRFTDPKLPPAAVAKSASHGLAPVARVFGSALPGEAVVPQAALLLPEAGRQPLAVRYDATDACGLPGVGPGARARYTTDGGAEELAILVRLDEEAAEDVLDTLRKLPGSRVIKQAPYRATRVLRVDDAQGGRVEWVFGQKGRLIAGVGRELRPTPVPKKNSPELNAKIVRLKKLLDGLRL